MRQGKSVRGALSYNEQKVRQGKADMLLAVGFSCDVEHLGFSEKLRRFQSLNERNDHVKTNTLHLSLNFPPGEQIADDKMQRIALDYMERIGFAGQPFLVYRHKDAKHPHVHIVTTVIKEDGDDISLHNIAKNFSEPARKALEIEYGLFPAEGRGRGPESYSEDAGTLAPEYDEAETKHKITNRLGEVLRTYKFCSLEELNGILRKFNIAADRGREDSLMYKNGGLVYSLVNDDGYRVGPAIKASDIYSDVCDKPILKKLQRRFAGNLVKKVNLTQKVNISIDAIFAGDKIIEGLTKKNIRLYFLRDTTGQITAAQFVDHRNKVVFTHDELNINLDTIIAKVIPGIIPGNGLAAGQQSILDERKQNIQKTSKMEGSPTQRLLAHAAQEMIRALLAPIPGSPGSGPSYPLKKKKKKKRPSF